jgi:hypothetical protein
MTAPQHVSVTNVDVFSSPVHLRRAAAFGSGIGLGT